MRTLQTKIITDGSDEIEGYDTTQEIELPQDISWELRFYCDQCGEEVLEDETTSHTCEEEEEE